MKKCIMSVLAAAAALFVTSCAKDAQVAEVTVADATVTFGVTAPELASRAFGEGAYARKLTVLVYDKNGYRRDLQVEQTMTGLTTTVEVNKLIKGEKYSFLFWAQSADATCFTLDAANGKVAINYATAMNNEKVDAFFAQELDMEAKANPTTKTVVLKRPFAQINLGTNDMDAFAANAFAAATSTLTIKHIYNTLDLHDGSVAGVGAVTIPAATIPAVGTKFKVGTADEYNYLALNYVLVEADKALVEVEYAIDNIAGIEAAKMVALQNIPVQRNYRTNLYGSLFTTSATFNVEILPGFVDEFNNGTSTFNMEGVEKIGVNEYNILNATGLVNASSQLFAKGGTFNITPDGTRAEGDTDVIDMTGVEYTAPYLNALSKVELVINGNNKTIKGLKDMLLERPFLKTLVIRDLTLDGTTIANTETGYKCYGAFIGDKSNTFETNGNIEFDNCHVVNASISTAAKYCAGFLPYYSTHSEGALLIINNCSVENSKFTGADTSVGAFLGHATGSAETIVKMNNITAKKNTITNTNAEKAGIVLGTIGAGKVYIDGYDVDISFTDNNVNGNNGRIYGRLGSSSAALYVNGNNMTSADLLYSDLENIEVELSEDMIFVNGRSNAVLLGGASTKTITITGKTGKEVLAINNNYRSYLQTVNPDAVITIKNCILASNIASGPWDAYDFVFYKTNAVLENVVINKPLAFDWANATLKNVTINDLKNDVYAIWITANGQTVKMENCNINTIGRAIKISDQYVNEADRKAVTLEINGGKFVANSKPAIYVGNTAGANVTVKNLDITGIKTGVMIARDTESTYANAPIYYNGNLLDAKVNVNGKGYASLKEAVAAAPAGSTITIEKNTTCTDQMSDVKDITFEGAADGSSVLDITAYDPYRWSGVTIKNMTLELGNSNYHGFKHAGEIKFVNCTIVGKIFGHGTHEVYENCTFKQSQNDYNMWVYGAAKVDYINCTFIGQGRFLHIYNESGDKNNVTLDGCKFINEATAKSEKAAVEIKIDCVNGKILNSETHINNCTLNDASLFNGLYRLSSNLGADINTSTTVKVYVDGTAVFDNK